MIAALLLPLLLSAQQPAAPNGGGEASVLVRYDLRPVLPRFDRGSGWQQSLVPPLARPHDEVPRVKLHEQYEDASPDVVLDVVTQVLGDELVFEGREIALDRDSRLLVLAPPETQAKVGDILRILESVLSASAQVRLDVLTFTDGGQELVGRSVVPLAAADRLVEGLVARGATHRRYALQLAAGRTAGVDQVQNSSFLYDYDVEIAQGSFIYDPIVATVEDGLRVLLRGVPAPGGVALSVLVTEGMRLGDVEERPLSLRGSVGDEQKGLALMDGPQSLQSVQLHTRSVAFSTVLPDDRALVVSSESDLQGRSERQVIVLRSVGGGLTSYSANRIAGTERTLVLVNTELFGAPEFGISGAPWSHEEFRGHPWLVATLNAEPSPFLFDWMKYRFSVWRRLGPWALIVTDPAWDDQAGAELEELVAGVRPQADLLDVSVELCTEKPDVVPVRWTLPVLAGTSCATVLGITSTAITDYDVEVAQFAAVPDPLVSTTFDGLALALQISRGGGPDGRSVAWGVEARGTAHRLQGPMTSFSPRGAMLGRLEQVTYDALILDERLTVPRTQGEASRVLIGPETRGRSGLCLRLAIDG